MSNLVQITRTKEEQAVTDLMEVDLTKVSSPVLRKLIEEVRAPGYEDSQNYSRFHNRHNRSSRPRPGPWVVGGEE